MYVACLPLQCEKLKLVDVFGCSLSCFVDGSKSIIDTRISAYAEVYIAKHSKTTEMLYLYVECRNTLSYKCLVNAKM